MTNLMTLVQDRLGVKSLSKWIIQCQEGGLSCREIAALVQEQTDVKVSKSTVHNWILDVTPKK